MPNGALEIQEEPVCWALPYGRAVWWSLRELNDAQPDQLAAEDSAEAYLAVARELSYDVLGSGDMDAIEKFGETPGTLQDQTGVGPVVYSGQGDGSMLVAHERRRGGQDEAA